MADESARPGTCRSKVGCEAMDEPCTNKILPAGPEGSPACLFHRNRRTSLPFSVQCSSPRMTAAGEMGLFIAELLVLDVSLCLFDHLVGESEQPIRHLEPRAGPIGFQPRSFGLYSVGFDEAGPFVDLGLHKGAEFVRRHRHRRRALLLPCVLHVRAREDFVDLGVQQRDDRLRSSHRRHHADPNRRFVAGNTGLRQRRHVGQDGRADLSGRPQRLDPSDLDHLSHARHRVEHHFDLPADDVVARAGAALVGDVQDIRAREVLKKLARHVIIRAHSRGGIIERAGLRLGECNEFLDRAHPSLGVSTVKEFIALAKSKPGALNYASSGVGSNYHMAGELFKNLTGTDILHVPYKGSSGARNDIISGQIEMMFDSVPSMAPIIQAGRVKALGTTGKVRSAILPDVPTLSEAGVPGYEATIWIGVMAPAGTPQPCVTRPSTEINKILGRADVRAAWKKQGANTMVMTPEQFGTYVQSEIDKWAKVIQANGIKPE